ncbi:hypothetical protein CHUAL_009112 [Chamberlinius hualienensis]
MAACKRRRVLFACKFGPAFLLQLIIVCVGWTAYVDADRTNKAANCASEISYHWTSMANYVTFSEQVKKSFEKFGAKVQRKNATNLVKEISNDINTMMSWKVQAVGRIMDTAEESMIGYQYDPNLKEISYNNAKNINNLNLTMTSDPHFYNISVNTNTSSVHVPTNVYDRAPEVLNAIRWSENINPIFQSNYHLDPSLSWQYFGSSTGFLRQFPAIEWPQGPQDTSGNRLVDTYDCRMRPWYIEAATHPKDIVILLDVSGSMTGIRKEIAKHVVLNILDTLNDDDYFAIYNFSDSVRGLVDCFNDSLVPANMENIREYKNHLQKMVPANVANFTSALTTAFDILKKYADNGLGSGCNQAIMLITDGAPQTYEDIFRENNWPNRSVRVFTYLIGQEMSDVKEVEWMACSNRGYYSHVSTLAEAREQVQNYIPVMARPLVLSQSHNVIWTSVYADIDDPKLADWQWEQREKRTQRYLNLRSMSTRTSDGSDYPDDSPVTEAPKSFEEIAVNEDDKPKYRLMTTVAIPVFDRSNKTKRIAHILGVAGTDVPIEEISKLATPFKLGVNGYAFAITNNGYILFHPDLRPFENSILKPDYNSVDLEEVELPTDSTIRDGHYKLNLLRRNMIDGNIGEIDMEVKIHQDDMKRVVIRNQHYFFSPLKGTPFSLALVIPDKYGMHEVVGQNDLSSYRSSNNITVEYIQDVLNLFGAKEWTVHPDWVYCSYRYSNPTRRQRSPKELLEHFLHQIPKKNFSWGNNPRVKSPPVTEAYSYERVSNINRDEAYCDHELLQSLVFDARATLNFDKHIPTKDKRATSASNFKVTLAFIATRSGLTRWEIFADGAEDAKDFIDNNSRAIDEIWYKRAVDYHYVDSQAYVFSVPFDAHQRLKNETYAIATHAIFIGENKMTAPVAVIGVQFKLFYFKQYLDTLAECDLDCLKYDCYILDNNGFVIIDNSSELPSKTGKFYGDVKDNIMDALVQHGIYNQLEMVDYQALCFESKTRGGSANILLTPFTQLKFAFSWFWYRAVMFYFQYSFSSWWHGTAASSSDLPSYDELNVKDLPYPCDKKFSLYELNHTYFKSKKSDPIVLPGCEGKACNRSFVPAMITHTNLMLLMVEKDCFCGSYNHTISHTRITNYTANYTITACHWYNPETYRKRPKQCVNYHPAELEIRDCGRGALTHLPSMIVILITVLTCIVSRDLYVDFAF